MPFAAAGLALAGCGGGGSSSTPTATTQPPPPTPAELAATATMKLDEAKAAVDAVMDDSDADTVTAAEMAVAAAEMAVQAASGADNAGALNRRLGNLETSLASKKASRTAAMKDAADDAANKARLASNAMSMKVAEAINKHDAAGDPPGEFLAVNTVEAGNVLKISRDTGAAKITPFQSAADKKNKPFTTGAAPDAGTGWSGMTFSRSGTSGKRATKEMAAVYTDIEALRSVLWASTTSPFPDSVTRNTDNSLTIAAAASIPAARFGGGASIPAYVKGQTRSLAIPATGLSGTLYGVSGRFTCTGGCSVSQSSTGSVTGVDLTFTPDADTFDADTTLAQAIRADADYTHFGYWMMSTKQRDGSYTHDIQTFHGGTGVLATDLRTVKGTAKYYGAAAGVYVKKDGAGDSLMVTDGKFTADAMLTARFGGDTIAQNKQNQVEGTISGFMDGSTDLGFAALKLRGNTATTGAAIAMASRDDLGSFSGETDGGGTIGSWSGQFYGNAGSGTTTVSTDDHPANVSGEFNGHFVNGHVAGAFGAEKD